MRQSGCEGFIIYSCTLINRLSDVQCFTKSTRRCRVITNRITFAFVATVFGRAWLCCLPSRKVATSSLVLHSCFCLLLPMYILFCSYDTVRLQVLQLTLIPHYRHLINTLHAPSTNAESYFSSLINIRTKF